MKTVTIKVKCDGCQKPMPDPAEDVCTCRTRRARCNVELRPCAWHRQYRRATRAAAKGEARP